MDEYAPSEASFEGALHFLCQEPDQHVLACLAHATSVNLPLWAACCPQGMLARILHCFMRAALPWGARYSLHAFKPSLWHLKLPVGIPSLSRGIRPLLILPYLQGASPRGKLRPSTLLCHPPLAHSIYTFPTPRRPHFPPGGKVAQAIQHAAAVCILSMRRPYPGNAAAVHAAFSTLTPGPCQCCFRGPVPYCRCPCPCSCPCSIPCSGILTIALMACIDAICPPVPHQLRRFFG